MGPHFAMKCQMCYHLDGIIDKIAEKSATFPTNVVEIFQLVLEMIEN